MVHGSGLTGKMAAAGARTRPVEGDAPEPVAVVFDLDRTITRHGTFTPFLIQVACARPIKFVFTVPLLVAGAAYALGLINRKRLKEFMLKSVLGGCTRDQMAHHVAAFVDRCLSAGLRPGARPAIESHRARGHFLILATASFDFYVERLGDRLGFDMVVATKSSWDERGRLSGRVDGENCYGAEKLRRLQHEVPQLWGACHVVAYSDSHADLPMLRWADSGVAVNPSRRLRKRAQGEDLQIVNWELTM